MMNKIKKFLNVMNYYNIWNVIVLFLSIGTTIYGVMSTNITLMMYSVIVFVTALILIDFR